MAREVVVSKGCAAPAGGRPDGKQQGSATFTLTRHLTYYNSLRICRAFDTFDGNVCFGYFGSHPVMHDYLFVPQSKGWTGPESGVFCLELVQLML